MFNFIFFTLLLLISSLQAQPKFVYVQKITPLDTQVGNYFGQKNAIAVSGDTIVVGVDREDFNSTVTQSGAAYVFEYNTLTEHFEQVAKLQADDFAARAWFGISVAIDQDVIVIGASTANNNAGAVYVFQKPATGWHDMNQTAKLTASDTASYDYFGEDVAIYKDSIAVGIPQNKKAVYIFEKNGASWINAHESAKLTIQKISQFSYPGKSIALDENTLVVGAAADTNKRGSVFVFEKSGIHWIDANETAKLTASDAYDGGRFGSSVAVDGDNIVVGTHYYPFQNNTSGMTYIFEKDGNTWADANETAKLTTSNDGDFYLDRGMASCMIGNTALSSTIQNYTPAAVFSYDKPASGWVDANQTSILTPTPEITGGTYYGSSLGCSTSWVIVGAPRESSNTGAVYIFRVDEVQAPDYRAVLSAHGTYAIAGTFGQHDFNNDGDTNDIYDWGFTFNANGITYALRGSVPTDTDVFGWLPTVIAPPAAQWYMFPLGDDIDGDGNILYDWILVGVNSQAVYKLTGVDPVSGTFLYSDPINISYSVNNGSVTFEQITP